MKRKNYIPRILLCGDEADFLARVDNRPFKIVGYAKISGEVDGQEFSIAKDGKVFFNDKLQDFDALKNFLLEGEVDYLLFTKRKMFSVYHRVAYKHDFISPKAITLEQFNTFPREFFYDPNMGLRLLEWLKKLSVKTLLDVDAFFATAKVFTKPANDFTEIDCVTEKTLPPIAENIYRRVYKNLAEVGLKRYDAVLLAERTPLEFDADFTLTENFSDSVFTFGRKGTSIEKHLLSRSKDFSQGKGLRIDSGNWFFVTLKRPPESFRIYVVTHKAAPHEGKLPDGYEMIHAGHALGNDFGYAGDDTGDNISDLNLYINELTALYWFWKNASDSVVGLCHYRRFFTTSDDETFAYEKILSREDALKILETHDIIVSRLFYGTLTQREFVENDCGEILARAGESILRKHLIRVQPEYVDALNFVLDSKAIYKCNMFVTRRDVLDAWCKWLFSFIIDATQEILRLLHLEKFSYKPRRLMSFIAERMLHVWLFKQNLRIKELNVMFVEGI